MGHKHHKNKKQKQLYSEEDFLNAAYDQVFIKPWVDLLQVPKCVHLLEIHMKYILACYFSWAG